MAEVLNPTTQLPDKETEKVLDRSTQIEEKTSKQTPMDQYMPDKEFIDANNYKLLQLEGKTPKETVLEGFDTYEKNINRPFNIYTDDIDTLRGVYQSGWKQAGNSIAQVAVNELGLGIVAGSYDLADAITFGKVLPEATEGYGNAVSQYLRDLQDEFREVTPIYTRNPGEFDMGDPGWWWSNLPSVASTISLAIPSGFAVRGIGAALKALQQGKKVNQLMRSTQFTSNLVNQAAKLDTRANRWLASGLGQAVLSRHSESVMEASGQWKETYEEAIRLSKEKGLSNEEAEEKAKLAASEAAADTYKNNWWALATDIPQYLALGRIYSPTKGKFISPNKYRRQLAGQKATKLDRVLENNALAVLGTAVSEGMEEGYQYLVGAQANHLALMRQGLVESREFNERMKEALGEGEFWTSAFFGAIGGGIFKGSGPVRKALANVRGETEEKEQARVQRMQGVLKGSYAPYIAKMDELRQAGAEANSEIVSQYITDNQGQQFAIQALSQGEESFLGYLDSLERLQTLSDEDFIEQGEFTSDTLIPAEERVEIYQKLYNQAVDVAQDFDSLLNKNPNISRKNLLLATNYKQRLKQAKEAFNKSKIKLSEASSEMESSFKIANLSSEGNERLLSFLEDTALTNEITELENVIKLFESNLEDSKGVTNPLQTEITQLKHQIEFLKTAKKKVSQERIAEAKKNFNEAELTPFEKGRDNAILSGLLSAYKNENGKLASKQEAINDYIKALAENMFIQDSSEALEEAYNDLLTTESSNINTRDHILKQIDNFDEVGLTQLEKDFDIETEELPEQYKKEIKAAIANRKNTLRLEEASKEAEANANNNNDIDGETSGDESNNTDPTEDVSDDAIDNIPIEDTPIKVGEEVIPISGAYSGQIGVVQSVDDKGYVKVKFEDGKIVTYASNLLEQVIEDVTDSTNPEEETPVEDENFDNDSSSPIQENDVSINVNINVLPTSFAQWYFNTGVVKDGTKVNIRRFTEGDVEGDYKNVVEEYNRKFEELDINDPKFIELAAKLPIMAEILDDSGNVLIYEDGKVQHNIYAAAVPQENKKLTAREKVLSERIKIAKALKEGKEIKLEIKNTPFMDINSSKNTGKVKENNITEIFGDNPQLAITNRKGVLMDLTRSQPKTINGKQKQLRVKGNESKIMKGTFYAIVKNPNGKESTVQLNIKHYNSEQAKLVSNLVETILANPQNANTKIKEISGIYDMFKTIYSEPMAEYLTEEGNNTVQESLESIMHIKEEDNASKPTATFFTKNKDKFIVGYKEDTKQYLYEFTKDTIGNSKGVLEEFLTSTKRHRVIPEGLQNKLYNEFILENNILNTDVEFTIYKDSKGKEYRSIFVAETKDGTFPMKLYLDTSSLDIAPKTTKEALTFSELDNMEVNNLASETSFVDEGATPKKIETEGKETITREEIFNKIGRATIKEVREAQVEYRKNKKPLSPEVLKALPGRKEAAIDRWIQLNNKDNSIVIC